MTSLFFRTCSTLGLLALLTGCATAPTKPIQKIIPQNEAALQTPTLPADAAPPAPPKPEITKVALLIPLTGANAPLGQAMLKAAQMAVFDLSGKNFALLPRDTGDTPTGAAQAAREALNAGARLIIGPLFAPQIPEVKAAAMGAHVPMLALSTDTSLAAPDVYVLGLAPVPQVERVIRYAAAHGVKRFAALVPDNAYGLLVGTAFINSVASVSGTVAAYEKFNPATQNVAAPLARLVANAGTIEGLFLPEDANALRGMDAQLTLGGLDGAHVRWLGTGQWDVATVAQQAPFLVNGWYAASDPAGRATFSQNYTATYGQEPPRLTTLAYDATALAAVLAERGAGFSTEALTTPNGFAGLDGIFRLSPQGGMERGLAVLQVTPDGNKIIEAAPATFEAKHDGNPPPHL